ncbi:hypothetical protein AKO1_007911 [Acrasis kona]|uniref:Uncharacterized protein n=1 Tax=Acrasis kona TaxID=1008807 RepID=A0AAW2YNL3_9EUKA
MFNPIKSVYHFLKRQLWAEPAASKNYIFLGNLIGAFIFALSAKRLGFIRLSNLSNSQAQEVRESIPRFQQEYYGALSMAILEELGKDAAMVNKMSGY